MTPEELITIAPRLRAAGVSGLSLDSLGKVTGVTFLPPASPLDADWWQKDLAIRMDEER